MRNNTIISIELRKKVIETFPLSAESIHGPDHWSRVFENARRISDEETGADARVLELFALFHDSMRRNDIIDEGHGKRGADYARRLRADGWFELDDEAFELLCRACLHHTEGGLVDHPTVITCWDADRLDLARCGITPDPKRLCTATARKPEIIAWAVKRSAERRVP